MHANQAIAWSSTCPSSMSPTVCWRAQCLVFKWLFLSEGAIQSTGFFDGFVVVVED